MNTYPCYRCGGLGKIQIFSHVLGGVCFACQGTGKQKTKPHNSDAKGAHIHNINAPTAEKAKKRALFLFANASDEFRKGFDISSITAMLFDEYWTAERIEKLSQ